MTFHAACARILRSEAERLGYTRQFTIYDQADARRLTKRCADAVGVDPKRYTPAAIHNQISAAKNRLRAASDLRDAVGSPFDEMLAEVYELYERDLHRANAMDFDDLLFRTVNLLELFEDVRERYAQAFRHVLVDEYQDTNYAQYRMLQLLVGGGREEPERGAPHEHSRAPQPGGRRRRLPVDLQLPRRGGQKHPRLPRRLPRRARGQARAELPLDRDDPARGQRGDREQPRRHRQAPVERARPGRADPPARARRRARRGAHGRRRDRAAGRRGRVALGDRGALPHERDVARDRGHAGAPRDRLPGDRRHEVLRARGDQGRDRLPAVPGQPVRRGELRAHRQLAAPRPRPDVAGARARATPTRPTSRCGRRRPRRRRCRGWARRRSRR